MPTAFVVCGRPGAGKTTYAQRLAKEHQAALLDIDTVTDRLVRLALAESGRNEADRDSAHFKQRFRQPIYDTLFDIARQNLAWLDVVIVAPFTREIRDSDWPARLQDLLGSAVEIHYVYCRPEIRRDRLAHRGEARDTIKLVDWNDYLSTQEEEKPPEFPHLFIDASEW
jgi:predicted kinase